MIEIKVFKYYGKYLYLYLNTVLTKVFATVFVFGKFVVFVFVFKYYAMYLDPSLVVLELFIKDVTRFTMPVRMDCQRVYGTSTVCKK